MSKELSKKEEKISLDKIKDSDVDLYDKITKDPEVKIDQGKKKKEPTKKSNYVMYYRQQNECHEIDDEKAGSIIGNLCRDP